MSRKKKKVSVWEALNQPVVEVTDEGARSIFLVTAVVLLMVWMMPGFGSHGIAAAAGSGLAMTESEYTPLFGEYPYYEEVAGEFVESEAEMSAPTWFVELAATGESLGEFYHETVTVPFADAAVEVLDISEPVGGLVEYFKPGTDAAWDAWLDLMMDPGT